MTIRARGIFTSLVVCVLALNAYDTALAGEPTSESAARERTVVDEIREQAGKVRPLVKTDAVESFLDAAALLPMIEPRVIYRDRPANEAFTDAEAAKLCEERRAACEQHTYDAEFYYYTGYGTPVLYARALDLAAAKCGIKRFAGKRVFDFGYGAIGHLRMLASLGADAVGVEVQPVFRALYSFPGDQGVIRGASGVRGHLKLVQGHWPGDADVRDAVGGKFDLIISKNVLKRGYVHPEREADPRQLVHLGVDDATFVQALYDALAPGGVVMIYNFSPAPAPPDKPYIPWADGRCPFDRELLEKTGFTVMAYDNEDNDAAYDFWFALDLSDGATRKDLSRNLFAHFTLLRKSGV
jgi:SAM-dependent methyltransferase